MPEPQPGIAGRVALVTGGASGIGRATVVALHAAGARVVSLDRAHGDGAHGPAELGLDVDVRDAEAVTACLARVDAELGGLHILVQCAGIARDGMLWKLSLDDWNDVIQTNLGGAFHVLRAAVPLLRREGGAVVHVGSINGERGKLGQANYAASKAGLAGLTRTAARELGRFGIRVNTVSPGLVRTPMTEGLPPDVLQRALDETLLGRVAEPEDVAEAILFLVSDRARQITGQTLRVDGGQYL